MFVLLSSFYVFFPCFFPFSFHHLPVLYLVLTSGCFYILLAVLLMFIIATEEDYRSLPESLAAIISNFFHPAVPATPTSTVCAVYDVATEALQIIESTWNKVVCCV